MRHINKRRLTGALSPAELNAIVGWFVASYDAGWRPEVGARNPGEELRAKLAALEDEQRVADGDVPWV